MATLENTNIVFNSSENTQIQTLNKCDECKNEMSPSNTYIMKEMVLCEDCYYEG